MSGLGKYGRIGRLAGLVGSIALLWAAPVLPSVEVSGETPPNILIIFADDLGYESVGAYGGRDFATPEIDRMAGQGMRFTRAYTSPVCTPSRVSFHTSLYTLDHGHTRVLPVHLGTTETVDFSKMPTFAQLLQREGYQTSVTGKWQLATLCHHPDHPYRSGFDSWCLWQIWDCESSSKTTRYHHPCLNRDGLVLDGSMVEEDRELPNGAKVPAGTRIADATTQFGSDVLYEYVNERMVQAVEAGDPFLIVHNMMLPHTPIVETPGGGEAALGNMIGYMDRLVGGLLDQVEQMGIRENTYVFFIGDNGTETRHARTTAAGLVYGGKRSVNDAGTHVPFLVWGPPGIPEGGVYEGLVDITDVFPTVCELAGVQIPSDLFIRGQSMVPQIHGQSPLDPRTFVHGGIYDVDTLFDGEWRFVKTPDDVFMIDARRLPEEQTVRAPFTGEAAEAEERLSALLHALESTEKVERKCANVSR